MKKEYPRIFTIAEKHGFKEIYNDNSNSPVFENEDCSLCIEIEDDLFSHILSTNTMKNKLRK